MAPRSANLKRNSALDNAILEAHEQYAAARPKSAALHAQARGVLAGGNTRSVLFYLPFPTAMAHGEECTLEDIDGNRYLDLCGEYTAGLFGHSDPRIRQALHAAIDRGLNLAGVGENESRLAALLCARFPALERVRFTNSGTEANMMALGAARAFNGKTGILAFRGGYHGSLLTVSDSMSPVNVPMPITLADYNDAEQVLAALRAGADKIGAVIIEPMMGSGGCIPASPDFLAALREGTREMNILLIFDEVMTSRHSSGGLQSRLGITPDLCTLGKYIAGGMSFGAFGGRADIMQLFDGHRPGALIHSGTFNNNVLSMSAGIVAMGEVFDATVANALFQRGEVLRGRLNAVCARHDVRLQFTGIGSMMQPHFRSGAILRPYVAATDEDGLRELFFFDMLAAGIYIARRGMVALSLAVADAHCDQYVAAVEEYCSSRGPLLRSHRNQSSAG